MATTGPPPLSVSTTPDVTNESSETMPAPSSRSQSRRPSEQTTMEGIQQRLTLMTSPLRDRVNSMVSASTPIVRTRAQSIASGASPITDRLQQAYTATASPITEGIQSAFSSTTGINLASTKSHILENAQFPPGAPGIPYVISSQDGEVIFIPLTKSATRLLITGKETDNAFAFLNRGGSQSDELLLGFHYHEYAHDVFLCLQGTMDVWAGDQCRTLSPGDFASVPPGVIHQHQILGPHSEFAALLVPGGGAEDFFRLIGESYAGPMWPTTDDQQRNFAAQAWSSDDSKLPGKDAPYFLKNGAGPAYEVGGLVCRPLITPAETVGKFSISSIEGAEQLHGSSIFANAQSLRFGANVHHAFQVATGKIKFSLDNAPEALLTVGDVVYVPAGTAFRMEIVSRFAKVYAFANGSGITRVLCQLGNPYRSPVVPEEAEMVDVEGLEALQGQHGFQIC